jgi:hypothetical protein
MPTRSFSVTRTGAGVGIAASRMADATTTAKDLTTKRKATTTVGQHSRGSAYAQRGKSHFGARHVDESQSGVEKHNELIEVRSTRAQTSRPACYKKAYRKRPRSLTQRASLAFPHAERDVLSGVTRDRDVAFISGPAACVGGVPLTRARNP